LNGSHAEKDAGLPEDSPSDELYWRAVPLWCQLSIIELDERRGEEYAYGFAAGLETGIIISMEKPEWSQGFFYQLRNYYLKTHSPEEMLDWERLADATARAIPVSAFAPDSAATDIRFGAKENANFRREMNA
jgi:hypothetical protein